MMAEGRPDPEALLRRVMAQEREASRGRLKVFLGYASRSGKTWRMLDEMRRRKGRGQDVVVGWMQGGEGDAEGLEVIPPMGAGGQVDVEAIIRRHPEVCMIDELAHDNPPGASTPHRWQDVETLLDAGLNVVTAINIQYLEGLQPRIRALLGPRTRATVPDRLVAEADEVVLVDACADEVGRRLERAGRGTDERVLSELREMALLYTADAIDERVEDCRQEHATERMWATQERILVCISAHPRAPRLLERGWRAAHRLHAELLVLYVTPDAEWSDVSVEQRTRVQECLALARTLHARVDVVHDIDAASAILAYGRAHHVTQIFVGHSNRRPLWSRLSRSVLGRIIRGAEGMDVHVASDRPPIPGLVMREARAPIPTPRQRPGRLRVYLGYAAGVGKTYQMLDDGNAMREAGHDVVVGWFEPHDRPQTMARVRGLPTVPRRLVAYRDRSFPEMDLPAVLARRPTYCLVDELAHTNVPGVEHEKRWQDVMDMLDAGIHVLSTVNVQHLESLNDLMQAMTGVRVRETVPDWVLDQAEEIVLVDLATRALRNRLARGVVYAPDKADAALHNFFREGNLEGLRELAMRQVAAAVEFGMENQAGLSPSGHVMACLSDHPAAAAVIRRAKRMADRTLCTAYAVFVASDERWPGLDKVQRDRVLAHLDLARNLNLQPVVLYGRNVARTLVDFSRAREITQIFMGRSIRAGLREYLFRNIIEQVIRYGPNLDIHVVADR